MNIPEVPLSFIFDSEGVVIGDLEDDLPTNLSDMEDTFFNGRHCKPVREMAEMIIDSRNTVADLFKHSAFCGGAAMAHQAFIESDMPFPLITPTLLQFSISSIPPELLGDTSDDTLDKIEAVARKGHASHPELREQTNFVMEYYAQTAQQAELGRIAYSGAGITIYQIDASWRRARPLIINKICSEAGRQTDWDSFFDKDS